MTTKPGLKGFYLSTCLIGLGFFTMGLMDPLYDSFVPLFLGDYLSSKGLIGVIMTLDNVFALFLIPIVSALSDRTRTPIGRRMPWIVVTLPLTALCFAAVPFAAAVSLGVLIAALFLLNVFKQAARGPVVALMPDTIPGDRRSEANGVINTMGGIAAIVGTVGLSKLMDVSIELPVLGNTARKIPFLVAGVLVVLATTLLFLFIKEKNRDAASDKRESVLRSVRLVFSGEEKSATFILLALLFWFFGYQGILPFLTMYTRDFLGVSEGTAGLSPGMFAVAYAVFAIPSGILAHRIGRKKTIRSALFVITVICLLLFLHDPLAKSLGLGKGAALASFWVLLFAMGTFWVAVITNSFPMLWQMATYETMGIYTGLYYTFSQAAAILSPPVTGTLIDLAGFRSVFFFGALCMFVAALSHGKSEARRGFGRGLKRQESAGRCGSVPGDSVFLDNVFRPLLYWEVRCLTEQQYK